MMNNVIYIGMSDISSLIDVAIQAYSQGSGYKLASKGEIKRMYRKDFVTIKEKDADLLLKTSRSYI